MTLHAPSNMLALITPAGRVGVVPRCDTFIMLSRIARLGFVNVPAIKAAVAVHKRSIMLTNAARCANEIFYEGIVLGR